MKFVWFLFLILNSLVAFTQSEWQNYASIDNIGEIEIYDSMAYVTNSGGLLTIDLRTGDEALLMPSNSTFEGVGVEIEFMSNGHAWISSGGRLLYFDGETFERFEDSENTELTRPESLIIFNDELWFLDFYGKLFSIKDKVVTDHSARFPDDIKYFALDSKGKVWVLNKKEIYEYDGVDILSTTEIYPGDEVDQLDAFYIDKHDILWMSVRPKSTLDLELLYIDNEDWNIFKTHYRVHTFFEHDSLGVCFSSNYKGFGYIEDGALGFEYFDSLFVDIPWGDVNRAKFKKWEDNNVWFTGSDLTKPVLHRYADGKIYQYGYNNVFLGEITDLEVDCNNNVYKAGESHLEKYVDGDWNTVVPDYTDDDCFIEYLEMNPYSCKLWGYARPNGNVGCNTLWEFSEDEAIEKYTLDFGVIALAFAPNGFIYVVVPGGTLSYIDNVGELNPICIDSTILFSDVFVSSDGMIWVLGTDYSDFCNITQSFYVGSGDGTWIEYDYETTQIRTGSSCHIFEDDMGNLWFESSSRLVQFDGTTWTSFPLSVGSLGYEEVLMDALGNFWIATRNLGLVYWDRDSITFYNTENSDIFADDCESIKRVENELWIQHSNGLSIMKLDGVSSNSELLTFSPKPEFRLFPNPSDGQFYVHHEGMIKRRYDVFTISGEKVISEVSNKEVWSSQLIPGVYIVKVSDEKGESVKKLIVH